MHNEIYVIIGGIVLVVFTIISLLINEYQARKIEKRNK